MKIITATVINDVITVAVIIFIFATPGHHYDDLIIQRN